MKNLLLKLIYFFETPRQKLLRHFKIFVKSPTKQTFYDLVFLITSATKSAKRIDEAALVCSVLNSFVISVLFEQSKGDIQLWTGICLFYSSDKYMKPLALHELSTRKGSLEQWKEVSTAPDEDLQALGVKKMAELLDNPVEC